MPHCIGAIDGKQVKLQKPTNSGSLFDNYKKCFSLSFLALADTRYQFLWLDIGHYSSNSDAQIFNKSNMLDHLRAPSTIIHRQ